MNAARFPKLLTFIAVLCSQALPAAATPFEKAKPVWPAGLEKERNSFIGFRTSFDAVKGARCFLRITGASAYRVSLNARFAGYGPARAAKGRFRVDTIPLAVRQGRNVLAVEAAGYNCMSYYHVNQPSFLQAEVVLDGRVVAATDGSGAFEAFRLPRVQKTVRYSYQRTYAEQYRLSAGFDEWKKGVPVKEKLPLGIHGAPGYLSRIAPYPDYAVNGPFKPLSTARLVFDSGKRTHATRFVDNPGPNGIRGAFPKNELESNWWDLLQRYSATNRVRTAAGAKTFRLEKGSSVMFDASLNDSGFPGMKVVCREPGTIAFKFDEILVGGEISPVRYSCANVIVWEFREKGVYEVEAFEPYTFRYAEVMAVSGAFTIDPPYMRTYKNPDARRAKFSSSDASLEKIFEAARETYAQNAVDVFTDCPGRERAGWLCDSFFTARASLLFTGSLDMETLFLENYSLPDSFENLPKGMFAMCYPADFPGKTFIPNWAMWLVLEVGEYARRGGDPALVERFRPKLAALVDYLMTFRNSDGLLEKLPSWVFIEWSKANSLVQDVNFPSNMMWAEVLDTMARLYGMKNLSAEASRVRDAVRRLSWTGEWFCDNAVRDKDGRLVLSGECTETCQYYAFYFRTAVPETHPALWKTLVDDFGPKRVRTKKHPCIWPANAFIGNYLRLECLSRYGGRAAGIYAEVRDYFLYMAERTGTLWENVSSTASCNHGFASHVAVTFARDFIGLREIDLRTKTVVFDPPRDLPVASMSMAVPVGEGKFVFAGWEKPSGVFEPFIVLPDGWRRICGEKSRK